MFKDIAAKINAGAIIADEIDPGPARGFRKGDFMGTYTGRFWPLDPREEEIQIEDIAHSHSMVCRYLGYVINFYSVAEHCCHLADYFLEDGEIELARWALLHDAPEAYLVDVPRPVKAHLPGYREMDVALMAVIARRFRLDGAERVSLERPMPERVAIADTRIINNEKANCRRPEFVIVGDERPLPRVTLRCWEPAEAERQFLRRFKLLFPVVPR